MTTATAPYGWTSTELPKRDRTPKTVRFWTIHHGSPVRLALQDGQEIRHGYRAPTDEGFHAEHSTYRREAGRVTLEWRSEGRDCDGRVSAEGECSFAEGEAQAKRITNGEYIEGIGGGEEYYPGLLFPQWEQGESSQRDHTAEAAGY